MDPIMITNTINSVVLLVIVAMGGAALYAMVRRLHFYVMSNEIIPIIMKRDIALLGALSVIGLETMILRALGLQDLTDWARLAYVIQTDAILLVAIGYWVKVELLDVDDPDVQ